MSYIVTIITAIISAAVSIFISGKNAKHEIEKLKIQNDQNMEKLQSEHNNEIERMKLQHQQDMERLEQEQKNELERLREEAGIKAAANLADKVTSSLTDMMIDSPALKNEVNKRVSKNFASYKSRR